MKAIRDIIIVFIICTSSLIAEEQHPRLISMAPSITEIVFQLGISDNLVGVTKFCNYPKEAKLISKVGGFLDPNLEAIISLKPDLVLLLEAENDVKLKLDSLKIKSISVEHKTIAGILSSIKKLGKSLGRSEQADKILLDISCLLYTSPSPRD